MLDAAIKVSVRFASSFFRVVSTTSPYGFVVRLLLYLYMTSGRSSFRLGRCFRRFALSVSL